MSGLFISAAGILNAQLRQNVTANNIANSQTTGYRASRVDSVETQGGGVQAGSITRSDAQGPLAFSNRSLDVASVNAYFRVRLPDGTTGFTRDGSFRLNGEDQVVTAGGATLDPPIAVPDEATSVRVASNGTVYADVPGQAPEPVGQLQVFGFPNPGGLEAIGGNLYTQTPASGEALPAADNAVVPGALQGSNTDLTTEAVNTTLNKRAFEANVNAFRAQDDILGDLLNLVR